MKPCTWLRPATGPISPLAKKPANATYPMRCDEGADPYQLRVGELGKFDLIHLGLVRQVNGF